MTDNYPHSIYACNDVTIPMELERGHVRGRLMFTYSFPEFRDIIAEHYERNLQIWCDLNDEDVDENRRFTRAQIYNWTLKEMLDHLSPFYDYLTTEIFWSQAEEDAFNGHEVTTKCKHATVPPGNTCRRTYDDIRTEIIGGHRARRARHRLDVADAERRRQHLRSPSP